MKIIHWILLLRNWQHHCYNSSKLKCLFLDSQSGQKKIHLVDHEGVFVTRFPFVSKQHMPWRHFFKKNFFLWKIAFIYLLTSRNCLIFENFCSERILRDLETIMEFLDYLILRYLALFLPIFSDLYRIHVFQSIVQKI